MAQAAGAAAVLLMRTAPARRRTFPEWVIDAFGLQDTQCEFIPGDYGDNDKRAS
jgi:hypothetical protein